MGVNAALGHETETFGFQSEMRPRTSHNCTIPSLFSVQDETKTLLDQDVFRELTACGLIVTRIK